MISREEMAAVAAEAAGADGESWFEYLSIRCILQKLAR